MCSFSCQERVIIDVPVVLPQCVVKLHHRPSSLEDITKHRPAAEQKQLVDRLLTLLRERVHPSVYYEGSDLRFQYSDRSETCYTGRVHSGGVNLACFLGRDGSSRFMHCFSGREGWEPADAPRPDESELPPSCSEHPPLYLGPLHAPQDTWRDGAIRVNVKYIGQKEERPSTDVLKEIASGKAVATDAMKIGTVLSA
jgi:hypothetical protein